MIYSLKYFSRFSRVAVAEALHDNAVPAAASAAAATANAAGSARAAAAISNAEDPVPAAIATSNAAVVDAGRGDAAPAARRSVSFDPRPDALTAVFFPNMSEALAFVIKCDDERRATRRVARCARELSCDLDGQHWSTPLPSRRSRRQPVRFNPAV